jgi:prevent-host-death family protein
MGKWQLQQAKARLSEVVKQAISEGPQEITVRGKPTAVLLSREEYLRLIAPRPDFLAFMRKSPLLGVDLDLKRDRSTNREVDLE